MRYCLVAVLALAALAPSCRRPDTGVNIDPALATIVPADTIVLAGVKVESIRQTPLYAKYIEKSGMLRIDELAQKSGFDPRKDLYELLFVSNGKDAIVMARGKFSPLGLEPKAGGIQVQRMNYKGLTLMGDEKSAVAFINPSVAVAGATPVLHNFLDHRTETNGIPKVLQGHMDALPPQSQVWAVTVSADKLAALIPQSGNMANLNRLLSGVQYATLSLDLRTGVDLAAQAVYGDEKLAKQTTDALRALLGFARLNTPTEEPDMLKAWDGILVNQVGTTMKLTAQLNNDLVDKLTSMVERRVPKP